MLVIFSLKRVRSRVVGSKNPGDSPVAYEYQPLPDNHRLLRSSIGPSAKESSPIPPSTPVKQLPRYVIILGKNISYVDLNLPVCYIF